MFNVESALCLFIAVTNKLSKDGELAIAPATFSLLKHANTVQTLKLRTSNCDSYVRGKS